MMDNFVFTCKSLVTSATAHVTEDGVVALSTSELFTFARDCVYDLIEPRGMGLRMA